jgi:prolipoprotein diacylglyceryl transferase
MVPFLEIGGLSLPTHDVFVALGVLVGVWVFAIEARRREMVDERLASIVLGALLLGGITARLSTGWKYLLASDHPTIVGLWLQGGRSIIGGLAGAYVGALLTKRLVGYRRSTGDLFAPAVALAMSIGRIGCFLTEQVGMPTDLPWGMTVSPERAAAMPFCPHCALGVPLHPSFLYEIAFHLFAFAALLLLRTRPLPEGELFKLYLLAYGVVRFLIEFVRANPTMAGPFSGSQLFLMITAPWLAVHVLRQMSRRAYRLSLA